MTEIAQLFESALRQNRSSLLRKAAMNTVAKMPAGTTLRELLESDAAEAIRELSLGDLAEALREAGLGGEPLRAALGAAASGSVDGAGPRAPRRHAVGPAAVADQSPEERLYRRILDAIADEALTIGQLSKRLELDVDELRGYLSWMKKMGKVVSSGRARATRYQAAP
jgi:hypothetical protein